MDFLTIKEVERKPEYKTKYFDVFSAHSGYYIGYIAWDTGWRRYVMNFDEKTKWSIECMAQCYKFIQQLMNDRKKERG